LNLRLRITRALSSLPLSSLKNNLLEQALQITPLVLYGGLVLFAGSRLDHQQSLASNSSSQPASSTQTVETDGLTATTSEPKADIKSQVYELKMHHLHTGESLDVVYRIGNTYLPNALAELNHFLRDHRTQDTAHYDPKEFDLLHSVVAKLGEPGAVIDVVCGYRTPWSNNFLRTRSDNTGVAKNSQHMQSKAIDIRIPGVSTSKLRDVAMSFHAGGVGYYPVSQFVHVDVGPVRHWTFAGSGDN
jgi:uncharacterized protein YcbK (DUF882 family)